MPLCTNLPLLAAPIIKWQERRLPGSREGQGHPAADRGAVQVGALLPFLPSLHVWLRGRAACMDGVWVQSKTQQHTASPYKHHPCLASLQRGAGRGGAAGGRVRHPR